MRRGLLFAAAAVLVAVGCSGDDGPTEQGDNTGNGTFNVSVMDSEFNPSTLSVPVNSTVNWNWTSTTLVHNVRFQDGPASSDQAAGTFARTFAAAGTYPYQCSFHAAQGMTGTITVTASTGGTGGTGGGGDTGGGGGDPYP